MKNIIFYFSLIFLVQFVQAQDNQFNPHFGLGIDYSVEQETKPVIVAGFDYKVLRTHIGVFPNFYKLGVGIQKGYVVFDLHQKYFVTDKVMTINWENRVYKHKSFVTGISSGVRYIFKKRLELNVSLGLDWVYKSQRANTNIMFNIIYHIKPHKFL